MRVPNWFREKLGRIDRRLRVRWSAVEHRFLIEEKIPYDATERHNLSHAHEDHVRRKDGYAFVLGTMQLDWHIFACLLNMDVVRFGGAQKYVDWLEEEEAKEELVRQQVVSLELDQKSHQAFDDMLWMTQNPTKRSEVTH